MAKLDNYSCQGQMNIFDFIEKNEPPILLEPGEHIFEVVKGTIYEYEVEDWTYTCGEDDQDRGYGLIVIDPDKPNSDFHTYSRVWNSSLECKDPSFFRNKDEAMQKAADSLKQIKYILAGDIKPNKVVAYEFNYYGRKQIYFYAELPDGSVYRDSDGCVAHIGKAEVEIETFNRGMKAKEEQIGITRLADYKPKFKDMCECKYKHWLYAEPSFHYETKHLALRGDSYE